MVPKETHGKETEAAGLRRNRTREEKTEYKKKKRRIYFPADQKLSENRPSFLGLLFS